MHLYDKILNSSIVSVYNYFLDIYILGVDQSDRMVLSVFVFFIVACLSVFALSVCLLSVFVFLIVALWRCCLSLYSLSSSIFLLLYGVIFCIRTVCPDFFDFFLALWRGCLSLYCLSSSFFLLLYGVMFLLRTICLHPFSSCSMALWFVSVLSVFIVFLVTLWCDFLSPYHLPEPFFLLAQWRGCLSLNSLS